MIKRRDVLYCSVAILALGGSSIANAADSTPESKGGVLEDIVVVAQRREERLQDVPFSVTALSAKSLEIAGITNSRDLGMVTPGLRVESTGPYVQPSLRGITTTLLSASNESNVATYVDGVYQPTIFGSLFSLPDVQDIEVLKGPQGTLFGRNATGGAILINTMKPDLETAKGKVTASYSSFNTFDTKANVSVPLVPGKLAASLTGMYKKSDGWLHNLNPANNYKADSEEWLVRGKIRFVPWEGADFVLAGLYSKLDDKTGVSFSTLNGASIFAGALAAQHLPFATKPNDFAVNSPTYVKNETTSFSLRGDIKVGPGTLTTTTAYNNVNGDDSIDFDNTVMSIPGGAPQVLSAKEKAKTISQELLYSTEKLGRFQGTVGAFYISSKLRQDPTNLAPAIYIFTYDKVESYAGFTELSYDVLDQLTLTGGLRYSHEKRDTHFTGFLPHALFPMPATTPAIPFKGSTTWNSTTPRVSLRYAVTDGTNVYATYSKGFKSGTYNAFEAGLAPNQMATPINPEKVDSYEVGFKSDVSSTLRISGSAFYYDYKDLQVSVVESGHAVTLNAGKAKIKGIELNGEWQAVDGLKLNFGGTYLDAKYKEFIHSTISIPGQPSILNYDASGNRMVRAPELSGNFGATYSFENSLGDFALSSNVMYSSKVYYEISNRVSQSPYAVVNAMASWVPSGTQLEVKVWAKNITDKAYIQTSLLTNYADGVGYAPPRTFGADVSFKF